MPKNIFSYTAILIVFLVLSNQFYKKTSLVVNNQKTCTCAYDGFGYYMYLPNLFTQKKLIIDKEWATEIQAKYCPNAPVYQFHKTNTGNDINIYHMGLSVLQIPGYIGGEIGAILTNAPRDGFSKPYYIGYLLNAYLFALIGIYYLYKLLKLYFSDLTTGLTILLIYLATNLSIVISDSYDLQHLYLFLINTAFLYHTTLWQKKDSSKHKIFSIILFGLSTFIRPTQAIFGLIPLIIIIKKLGLTKQTIKAILPYPITAFIWNTPQIIYWLVAAHKPIVLNLHTEDLTFSDPYIFDFLFSYKKGWLLYSPLFIILPLGFYKWIKSDKSIAIPTLTLTLLFIFVMGSWECWWYADSVGSRAMIDIYGLLAIPIAFTMESKLKYQIPIILFGILCLFQSETLRKQARRGYYHTQNMTKNSYWDIFGKTHIKDHTTLHYEINRSELNWPSQYANNPFGYQIDKGTFLKLTEIPKNKKGEGIHIGEFPILNKIKTDETQLEIQVISKTSDPSKNAQIRFETKSKYNTYDWHGTEISLNKSKNYDTINYTYNLPRLRHKEDQLHIYVSYTNTIIDIQSININYTSLNREKSSHKKRAQ